MTWKTIALLACTVGYPLAVSGIAWGQIIPDRTLGTESSRLVPVDASRDRVDGGTVRGENLFHSFSEFNVGDGRIIEFASPAIAENILTRVTGNNASQILGTLSVVGDANLFLLNPNGIFFGTNARLDLGGSFFATTADAFVFANDSEFSAVDPQVPSLLTVNVPIGLQFGSAPGTIAVSGNGIDRFSAPISPEATPEEIIALNRSFLESFLASSDGLRVRSSQTLALVGGEIDFDGGIVLAPGGRVEIGSVGVNSRVNINPNSQGFELDYTDVADFGNLRLDGQAGISSSDRASGTIQVVGDRVTLSNGSQIDSSLLGDESGGNIFIRAREAIAIDGVSPGNGFPSAIFSVTYGAGRGADIALETQQLTLSGGGQTFAVSFGTGDGGSATAQAVESIAVVGVSASGETSGFGSVAFSSGDAGTVSIETTRLSLGDGAQIFANTRSQGNAGAIDIRAREAIAIDGIATSGEMTTIAAATTLEATGNGGDITMETGRLQLTNGAQISTNSFGLGNAGSVIIQSDRLSIDGGASVSVDTFGVGNAGSLVIRAGEIDLSRGFLFADANAEAMGDGGDITIESDRLRVADAGSISVDTFGQGNAGDLTVRSGTIALESGSLFADVNNEATGNGGNLNIETDRLSVSGGGTISARVFGQGNGGNLNIETDGLFLTEGGSVGASTFGQGNAGNITIVARDAIALEGRSESGFFSNIAAIVGSQATGNGGRLAIETPHLRVGENTFISVAVLGRGDAGSIAINADRFEIAASGFVSVDTFAEGNAGDLQVRSQLLSISGGALSANVGRNGTGEGGNVAVNSDRLFVSRGGNISASTLGRGNAGNLTVLAAEIELAGGNLFADVQEEATGSGGNLTVEADRVFVGPNSRISASTFDAGDAGNLTVRSRTIDLVDGDIFAAVSQEASGRGGNLTLEGDRFSAIDGGQVGVATFGSGDAGTLTVRMGESISLTGVDGMFPSLLSASSQSGSTGNGGNLIVETDRLLLRDGGEIGVSTFGAGNGGNGRIVVGDLEIVGRSADGTIPSGILAQSGDDSISSPEAGLGRGGNLDIVADRITIDDGGEINVSAIGSGAAGNLDIRTQTLRLENGSRLTAETRSGRGNIAIDAEAIVLRRGSTISTNAFGDVPGGNIILDAGVLAALENSDISANAENATGGRVIVNAQSIFGTEFRDRATPESDITATSALGASFAGTVQVNTPDIDSTSGVVDLSPTVIDIASLVDAHPCDRAQDSEFTITGRGGLPPTPTDGTLFDTAVEWSDRDALATGNTSPIGEPTPSLVEARGWAIAENGSVVLVAGRPLRWEATVECGDLTH